MSDYWDRYIELMKWTGYVTEDGVEGFTISFMNGYSSEEDLLYLGDLIVRLLEEEGFTRVSTCIEEDIEGNQVLRIVKRMDVCFEEFEILLHEELFGYELDKGLCIARSREEFNNLIQDILDNVRDRLKIIVKVENVLKHIDRERVYMIARSRDIKPNIEILERIALRILEIISDNEEIRKIIEESIKRELESMVKNP